MLRFKLDGTCSHRPVEDTLDTTLSEWDRASILVKFYDRRTESNIVPEEFTVAMWQLARDSDDRRVRSSVWNFLGMVAHYVDHVALVAPQLFDPAS